MLPSLTKTLDEETKLYSLLYKNDLAG